MHDFLCFLKKEFLCFPCFVLFSRSCKPIQCRSITSGVKMWMWVQRDWRLLSCMWALTLSTYLKHCSVSTWTYIIMGKNSNSYSIHNKANTFIGNVVHQLNHDIAKGMCIAFHLQPTLEAIVWKELTHGGMKLNTSDDQVHNGCHEILWSDLSKDVMHKVLAWLPIPRLIQVRSICK